MLNSRPWLLAILLSFAAHLLLIFFMAMIPSVPTLRQNDVTEVEILTPPAQSQKSAQQIVRQTTTPDQLQAADDETLARFLSQKKQRVKKESQSANKGLTKNNQPEEKKEKIKASLQQARDQSRRDLAKEGFESWNPGRPPSYRQSDEGPSATGESLPRDVSIGSFTALNTDRFTFYTFYARIEEMIRYRWESRVQSTLNSFNRNTLLSVGERAWVTSAEFLLDPQGKLIKVLVMKESGIKEFDAAAVGAFREAGMFPNPPQELVQEDGYIHLKYNFTVSYNPPPIVR